MKEELDFERRRRVAAEDMVHFLNIECQFERCSCRLAESQGRRYIYDAEYYHKFQKPQIEAEEKARAQQASIQQARVDQAQSHQASTPEASPPPSSTSRPPISCPPGPHPPGGISSTQCPPGRTRAKSYTSGGATCSCPSAHRV
ncbi:hypothetical protein N7516_005651 [Penicillium verrucosum]|uniref:uncharacterized protein n=1 Tax=Penicillium verrucosum TaxID=60171 RepID=UPI00254515CD|nr:uncharacterized protein N7516_005651 [Penicillium verrucosum]KAJ5945483.1 hypothetical protein N7516_005651 [Penicillium verrucosum]